MTEQTQELDAKDLKVMAFRQRVAEQEDQIADLRVQVTILNAQLEQKIRESSESDDVGSETEK
jgi:hypothetical protein